MPIKQAAKKYLRQSTRRRTRNDKRESKLESAIDKTMKFVVAGKLEDAKTWLKTSQQLLDKAAGKGLIKKNNAARRLSRLHSKINKVTK